MLLHQIIFRSLCDEKPKSVTDCAFLYGQTIDNQSSVFSTARQLVNTGSTRKILIMGTGALSGYPGFQAWKTALLDMGLAAELVEGAATDQSHLHTRIEARAAVCHALAKGYRSIHVIAAPFQQPRAFMTAVTIAIAEYPELLIYSQPGATLPWSESVVHSQGTLSGPRYKLIDSELERIKTYQAKGDLASFEEVLDYLDRRNKLASKLEL
jgi:hypothetical protein